MFPYQVGLFPKGHKWTVKDFKNDLVIKLEATKKLAEDNIKQAQQRQKEYTDRGLTPA